MGKQTFITVDLGYGDSGKGTIVDALARRHEVGIVVRYNGGAQAAHNVITPEGEHHTFRQFGSATFLPDVRTLLSRFMLVDPLALSIEAARLNQLSVPKLFERMYVDERCTLVTPYHKALNRLREWSRGDGRHGSCGMGIGETVQLAAEFPDLVVRAGDIHSFASMVDKLSGLRKTIADRVAAMNLANASEALKKELHMLTVEPSDLALFFKDFFSNIQIVTPDNVAALLQTRSIIFEGAQGVLLDQDVGFHPYTTWSKTTSENAYTILTECEVKHPITEIGIMRTFPTRHGPGPFVTEHEPLKELLPNEHNTFNEYQRGFRTGWLDIPMLNYALDANGSVDYLAVTHVDCLDKRDDWTICEEYEGDALCVPKNIEEQSALTERLLKTTYEPEVVSKNYVLDAVQIETAIRIGIMSHGPKADDKWFTAAFEPALK